jgi:methyl-accepting chemotaxis protein PixJ
MTTTSPESTSALPETVQSQSDFDRPLKVVGKRSIWSSIRLKATLLAVAIGTLPVIGIGSVAYYFANRSLSQQINATQTTRATEISDKMNRFMNERYNNTLSFAKLPILVDTKLRTASTKEAKQAALDQLAEVYEVFDSIAVYDLAGNLIANSTNGLPTPNIASTDYFQVAIKSEISSISKPELSPITNNVGISIATPIKDSATGQTTAVMLTRMPITFIDDIVKTFVGKDEEYHVFDASGKFFIALEKQQIGREASDDFPGLDQVLAKGKTNSFISVDKIDNSEQLVGYAPLPKFANMPLLNWSTLLAVDTSIAFKAQRELLLTLVSGTGFTALVVGALAVWLASRFAQPIVEAADAVEKVGQGELDTRLQTRGNDELAVLGTNINQMAEQIQALLDNAKKSAAEIEQQREAVVQESEVLQSDVGHILDVVSALEDGDLTIEAEVSDRATGLVSDTLNRLVEQLGQVLAQVQVTSQQVSTRSSDLEELAKTVAGNAASQAQEAQRVLSLTNQVQDSASSSAKEIDVANQSLLNMNSTVEQGQDELNTMNQGINDLQQGADRIVQQMKTLGEFVGLAEQFVQDQSQIASLTQVLALNATLVAARASEQKDPRKFMVVAREFEAIATQVGNLAQQTNSGLEVLQQRTNQINAVVSGVDAEVQGLGSLVNGFTKGVAQSSQVFSNVQTIAGDALQSGTAVTKSNQEIIAAAQATAQAMRDIAVLADRTAKLTQTTRAQSEQMGNLSDQLLKNVQFFRLPARILQEQEVVQRVDLSQADEDTVAIASSKEDSASLELVNASESVRS